MKSLNKLLFLIAIILFGERSLAQETVNKGDMIIHIKINGVNFSQKELIDIFRRNDEAKIIYAKFDSVKNSELRKDTTFTNISKPPYRLTPEQQAQFDKIFERYSVYHKNIVIVNLRKDGVR